jgi:hypothetical protein
MAKMTKELEREAVQSIVGKPMAIWLRINRMTFLSNEISLSLLATDKDGKVCVNLTDATVSVGNTIQIFDVTQGLVLSLEGEEGGYV